ERLSAAQCNCKAVHVTISGESPVDGDSLSDRLGLFRQIVGLIFFGFRYRSHHDGARRRRTFRVISADPVGSGGDVRRDGELEFALIGFGCQFDTRMIGPTLRWPMRKIA